MSRLQRTEKKGDANLLTAEFTTGQLVVVICVSLFIAMACFGLGILVARIDPSFEQTPTNEMDPAQPVQTDTYTLPAFGAETSGETTLTSAPAQEPPEEAPAAQKTPEMPPPRSPFMENKPRLTALPPLSSQRPAPMQIEAPGRMPRTEEGEGEPQPQSVETAAAPDASSPAVPTPAVQEASPAAASSASTSPPSTIVPPPAQPTQAPLLQPLDPVESATPLPAAPQPAVQQGSGKFGVQLGAFSGGDRQARAKEFQKRLRDQHNIQAEIIPSNDDVHHRVLVVGFQTREAANAACAELRKKAGLGEAFVKPL